MPTTRIPSLSSVSTITTISSSSNGSKESSSSGDLADRAVHNLVQVIQAKMTEYKETPRSCCLFQLARKNTKEADELSKEAVAILIEGQSIEAQTARVVQLVQEKFAQYNNDRGLIMGNSFANRDLSVAEEVDINTPLLHKQQLEKRYRPMEHLYFHALHAIIESNEYKTCEYSVIENESKRALEENSNRAAVRQLVVGFVR